VTVTERAYIGLGSNLGDRVGAIADALRVLSRTPGIVVSAVSHVYESEPWGVTHQPPFANAVAALDVDIDVHALLAACKRIESESGRTPGLRYGPRPIDLDVLLFGDWVVDTPDLVVPHPRLLERDFVVTPLLEIAPDLTLPDGMRPSRERASEGRVTSVIGTVSEP
jgi:2-amino-4-hydroxy-6-hydroxymethyldihydropteridine diphosphokinase